MQIDLEVTEPKTVDRGPLNILGASARAAAQSAARSGFQPYAIDLFGDRDLQEIGPAVQIERYPTEFLTALAAAPRAPWIYTGSLENYPRLVQRLAKLRPLIGNGPEVLTKVRDPHWLAEVMAGSAVRYPETVLGGQESGIRSQASEVGEWLLKPIRSGGGMGIRRCGDLAADLRSLTSAFCLQRVVLGQPISASFIALNGQAHWIGATEQWTGLKWGAPQEFQYAGSCAPLAIGAAEQAALLDVAQLLTNEAGLCGLFGLDLIRNDEGLWLIEVNPRYTASMELLEQLTGRPLIAEQCSAGDVDPPSGGRGSHRAADFPNELAAKLIVYADRAGSAGKALSLALDHLSQQHIRSADIPRMGTAFEPGNPICTLLTNGDSREETASRLLFAAGVVRRAIAAAT